MASRRTSVDNELEQLRRYNRLVVNMLCHLISSGYNGTTTIREESLDRPRSLQISHHAGDKLVLTVEGEESAATHLVNLSIPITGGLCTDASRIG
jgi:hypothetical protein